MMMMPVVSMKNMDGDSMETQSMTMLGSDNIEHVEQVDDYDYEPESRDEQKWVAHIKGKKYTLNR